MMPHQIHVKGSKSGQRSGTSRALMILLAAGLLASGAALGRAAPVHAVGCGVWYPYHIGSPAVESMYDYTQQKRSAVDFQTTVWAYTDLDTCQNTNWRVMVHYWTEDGSLTTFYTFSRMGFQGQGGIWAHTQGSPTGRDIYTFTDIVFGCCGAVAWGDDYQDAYGTSYYLNGNFSPSSQTGYSNA